MSAVGQYVLRLVASALICGILSALFGKKGTFGALIQLLTGVFLTLNIVSPWVQLRLEDWSDLTVNISSSAEALGQAGENAAAEEMAKRIREQTGAYILDKAQALDTELTVEVILDSSRIPRPCGVRISGNISPYAKKVLSNWMQEELGIPTEEQIWIGYR